jgi:hypothetical protein
MKKVILTLALAIVSVLSFAQVPPAVIETYSNRVGVWNQYTKEYDYEEWISVNLTFTIYKEYITVNDRTHSLYRIMEDQPVEYTEHCKVTSAKCLDEGNRSCLVALMKCDDESASINVIYGDKIFIYMIK